MYIVYIGFNRRLRTKQLYLLLYTIRSSLIASSVRHQSAMGFTDLNELMVLGTQFLIARFCVLRYTATVYTRWTLQTAEICRKNMLQ